MCGLEGVRTQRKVAPSQRKRVHRCLATQRKDARGVRRPNPRQPPSLENLRRDEAGRERERRVKDEAAGVREVARE